MRHVVTHLVGMNRVFAALLADEPPPRRGDELADDELGRSYRESATSLLAVFGRSGALDRRYEGRLGQATGAERLKIRLYDLLAHGWDLAHATGQPADLPEDAVEQSLRFVREQLDDRARPGRFGPAQSAPDNASKVEQLVAYLGRPLGERTS